MGCLFPHITALSFSSQVGFINSLKFSSAGDFLVAGVGQEHRYEAPLEGGQVTLAGWEWRWIQGGAGPELSCFSHPCRLGRWWRIKEARNSVCIIPLHRAPRPPAAGS